MPPSSVKVGEVMLAGARRVMKDNTAPRRIRVFPD
jgi:hypothetical protein